MLTALADVVMTALASLYLFSSRYLKCLRNSLSVSTQTLSQVYSYSLDRPLVRFTNKACFVDYFPQSWYIFVDVGSMVYSVNVGSM